MQLGEVARAYLAAESLRTRIAAILASLLIERILDVLVLLVIVSLAATLGSGLEAHYRTLGLTFAAAAIMMAAALCVYAAYTEAFIRAAERAISFLPVGLRERIVNQLRAGAAGLQILRQPGRFIQLAGMSLLQWTFMCACVWISLAAIGQYVSVGAALALLATTILSMTLPAGPGYVGTLQLAYVFALSPYGISRDDALAASFFYLAALWLPLVAGGMLMLHRMGLRLKNVTEIEARQNLP